MPKTLCKKFYKKSAEKNVHTLLKHLSINDMEIWGQEISILHTLILDSAAWKISSSPRKKVLLELLVVVLINFKVIVKQRTICIIVQHVITLLTEKARARRGQCIPISNLCCPVYITDATLADSCTWMPS